MKSIVVYGLGHDFEKYNVEISKKYNIIAITDSIEKELYYPYKVIKPLEISKVDVDGVLVCTRKYYVDVYKKLIRLGISKKKILNISEVIIEDMEVSDWIDGGRCTPSPDTYKGKVIREYGKNNNCSALIETGTYQGEMVVKQLLNFDEISTIELFDKLYEDARIRFCGIDNVRLYHGDSGELIGKMIDDIGRNKKILFWLDGHYSGEGTAHGEKETPIVKELEAIKKYCQHGVILIDDARCFKGEKEECKDYPSINEIYDLFRSFFEIKEWKVEDDIIRIIY